MTHRQLQLWRMQLQWNQQRAAEELGLSKRMYCYYEHGDWDIPRTVELACEALLRRHNESA